MSGRRHAKIFVSSAGDDGAWVGNQLRELLTGIFGTDLEVFAHRESLKAGAEWYSVLRRELVEADRLVCLVDHHYRSSAWCNVELGMFLARHAAGSRATSAPLSCFSINPDDDAEPTGREPLEPHQVLPLTAKTVKTLVADLRRTCRLLGSDPNISGTANTVEQLEVSVRDHFEQRREQTSRNRKAFFAAVDAHSRSAAEGFLLAPEERRHFATYLRGFKYDELVEDLKGLVRSYEGCLERSESGDGWEQIWAEVAQTLLSSAREQIQKASIQRIVLYDSHYITVFWNESIMTKVERSIWTTNLPGTYGRRPNKAFLRSQQQAVAAGRDLIRVFVYRPEDKADLEDLKVIVKQQHRIKIKVYVMAEEAFDQALKDAPERQRPRDFMIIDDRFVYTTDVDDDSHLISQVTLIAQKRTLDVAKQARKEIMAEATPINDDNVDSWWHTSPASAPL